MARYIGPSCRLCRREGEKLFLKGERCFTPKCAFERRSYVPGEHGRAGMASRNNRQSDYARQLRAKQKARRVYGILEKQFSRYFKFAKQKRGLPGLNLLQTLELRMDNVVYRMGLASSRAAARQMVNHGHFTVNGRRSDIPSMLLKVGDEISVREASRNNSMIKALPDLSEGRQCAMWLARDLKALNGRVLRIPERGEIDGNLDEQLIIEYYSR